MTLGTLGRDGKLDWDKPVRETFRTSAHDPVTSERNNQRDLVSHRSGCPATILHVPGRFSLERNIERTAFWSRNTIYGRRFSTATALHDGRLPVGQVAGTTWEELTRQKVLLPLEGSAPTSRCEMSEDGDFALPYTKADEGIKEIPHQF